MSQYCLLIILTTQISFLLKQVGCIGTLQEATYLHMVCGHQHYEFLWKWSSVILFGCLVAQRFLLLRDLL